MKTSQPQPEHYHTGGWGGIPGRCGVECACGTAFDGFDTIAEALDLLDAHIACDNAAAVEPTPSDRALSRLFLAFPVLLAAVLVVLLIGGAW